MNDDYHSSTSSLASQPLSKCRVLYLGSAVPLETSVGLEAIQRPLSEKYPCGQNGNKSDKIDGIDSVLTVFGSGIQLQYRQDRSTVIWFPIQNLYVCAAVRCVQVENALSGEREPRFVSLDSPLASNPMASRHPPMFSCIMRRTAGVKILECHAFICKSGAAAMSLVRACMTAYENKDGWSDDPVPPVNVVQNGGDTPYHQNNINGGLSSSPNSSMSLSISGEGYKNNETDNTKIIRKQRLPQTSDRTLFDESKDLTKEYNLMFRVPGTDRSNPLSTLDRQPINLVTSRMPQQFSSTPLRNNQQLLASTTTINSHSARDSVAPVYPRNLNIAHSRSKSVPPRQTVVLVPSSIRQPTKVVVPNPIPLAPPRVAPVMKLKSRRHPPNAPSTGYIPPVGSLHRIAAKRMGLNPMTLSRDLKRMTSSNRHFSSNVKKAPFNVRNYGSLNDLTLISQITRPSPENRSSQSLYNFDISSSHSTLNRYSSGSRANSLLQLAPQVTKNFDYPESGTYGTLTKEGNVIQNRIRHNSGRSLNNSIGNISFIQPRTITPTFQRPLSVATDLTRRDFEQMSLRGEQFTTLTPAQADLTSQRLLTMKSSPKTKSQLKKMLKAEKKKNSTKKKNSIIVRKQNQPNQDNHQSTKNNSHEYSYNLSSTAGLEGEIFMRASETDLRRGPVRDWYNDEQRHLPNERAFSEAIRNQRERVDDPDIGFPTAYKLNNIGTEADDIDFRNGGLSLNDSQTKGRHSWHKKNRKQPPLQNGHIPDGHKRQNLSHYDLNGYC